MRAVFFGNFQSMTLICVHFTSSPFGIQWKTIYKNDQMKRMKRKQQIGLFLWIMPKSIFINIYLVFGWFLIIISFDFTVIFFSLHLLLTSIKFHVYFKSTSCSLISKCLLTISNGNHFFVNIKIFIFLLDFNLFS